MWVSNKILASLSQDSFFIVQDNKFTLVIQDIPACSNNTDSPI